MNTPTVVFKTCPMFDETVDRQVDVKERILNRVKDFIDYKSQDHRAQFGSNDIPLASGGIMGDYLMPTLPKTLGYSIPRNPRILS